MNDRLRKEVVAEMILGTVQLGKNYGIHNLTGCPEKDTAFEMLDYAYEHGIKMLDTGPMYGNSEEVIGQYLGNRGKRFGVSTKLPDHIPNEEISNEREIEEIVKTSLKKIGVESAYCYYLHQYYQCKNKRLMNALLKCREKGLMENLGVSIYHPEELIYICENIRNIVDAVQIPYNIFSVSIWDEALGCAKAAGVKIFARSIFLQGLAFLESDNDFAKRIGASKYIDYVHSLAACRGTGIEQTCYDAVAGNQVIEDVLIGCETLEQLKNNLKAAGNYKPFSEDEISNASEYMKDIPMDIIDPQTWNKYR